MSNNEFSLKELYNVSLKATYPIEIRGVKYAPGDIITVFDKIQMSVLNEITSRVTAHGGYGDRPHVFWEDTKRIDFAFSQGIFSELQLALLGNNRLLEKKSDKPLEFTERETVETDSEGKVVLRHEPKLFWIHDAVTFEEVAANGAEGKTLDIGKPYESIVVDYTFDYCGTGQLIAIGQRLIPGYLRMEGRTRVKDDITGKTRTGIIIIPQLKLMSDISMRLGRNTDPVIASFQASGFPIGPRENSLVMEMFTLDEDIDSDI